MWARRCWAWTKSKEAKTGTHICPKLGRLCRLQSAGLSAVSGPQSDGRGGVIPFAFNSPLLCHMNFNILGSETKEAEQTCLTGEGQRSPARRRREIDRTLHSDKSSRYVASHHVQLIIWWIMQRLSIILSLNGRLHKNRALIVHRLSKMILLTGDDESLRGRVIRSHLEFKNITYILLCKSQEKQSKYLCLRCTYW